MIVPPNMWFHQHFNTGPTPARYLAFKHEVVSIRNAQGVPKAWISRRIGGDQIDYADETPLVRDIFATSSPRHGIEPKMDEAYKRNSRRCRRRSRNFQRRAALAARRALIRIGRSEWALSTPASANAQRATRRK